MSLLPSDHRYSYSQLLAFSECPFGYYLKNIENVQEQSNGFAEQGSLIHKILDEWAKKQIKKEDMAAEYARRYADSVVTSFPYVLASKGYTEKTYLQGLEYFENFDEFPGYTVISAEEKFVKPLELADGTTRPFVAVVDLILREEFTGSLVVVDHKSKSAAEFKKHRDEMYNQQYLYSYFVHEKYGEWPQYLMFNLFKANQKDEQEFSKAKYDEVIQWATNIIHKIESYDVLDWMETKEQKVPGKPDMYCSDICSVRGNCTCSIKR